MSLMIKSSGLYGLVMKIHDEIKEGKSLDEILSKYPVSKTSLPYLLTMLEEFSLVLLDIVKDYGELEQKNISLEDKIKRLETQNEPFGIEDIEELQKRLKMLEREKKELQEELNTLSDEVEQLQKEVENYNSFIFSSWFFSRAYQSWEKKNGTF